MPQSLTLVAQERVQQRTVDETVEVVGLAPRLRVQQRTVEETVEVQENVEIVKIVAQEQSF